MRAISVLTFAVAAAARALAVHPNRLNHAHLPLFERQESTTLTLDGIIAATPSVSAVTVTPSLAPPPSVLPKPPSSPPAAAPAPTPTPLDTSISSSLSHECMTYLTNLISNSTFLSCLPFSLLLQTSNSYRTQITNARSSGNYSYLNELVAYAASPAPGSETCDQTFAGFAETMRDRTNCGSDLNSGMPVARQARRGLSNYAAVRTAAGLVNPDTGSYCYLEAAASERPDDAYLWQLPMGNILPSTSIPTCSKCSALVMNHWGTWSTNTTTLNGTMINSAASTINAKCGANFVSVTVQTDGSSASRPRSDLLLPLVVFAPLLTWVLA
ncbi:hypothetical protein CcaverHIS002_0509060 [Cutaneotrichosporon cavernicola]|uniref:DUF7729 domain-containing protein n=1 Tax=Cutaneotrichosporon cavernicola TaxID=279322 RepID=A0AA48L7B8_9TREE|nr:uncharacterized protein CcaverHIS019_0509620 [Cutaneotrichosporon cavernicola]BEI85505.1 hypothetical protein CcaverHIS002_0509060 [Cutaneotrichosporon cavernicola]BEI93334.1 hypothetical protein CcaverHIS019_0509620 [Cutaneotrichosporon cavernicola]BEJ01113.1 hypothetical protein CcaverHIS631_0509700 [Cutaneotrichosporon cavernicola]BEJ08881.1 hypothetical protein CcaverHIS641_0509750 [Cutaneotrichosporon cavernicola]